MSPSPFALSPWLAAAAGLLALFVAWRGHVIRSRDREIHWLEECLENEHHRHSLVPSLEAAAAAAAPAVAGMDLPLPQAVTSLAHEFNNILTVVQGHTAFLLDDLQLERDSLDSAGQINSAAERLSVVVRQMLALCGAAPVRPRAIEPGVAAGELGPLLHRVLGTAFALKIDIAPGVAPLMADAGMFQQIMANIALNARDSMPEGGEFSLTASEVRLDDAAHRGQFVRFQLRDNGPGYQPSDIPALFEPFYTSKLAGRGSGLALPTAALLAKQNGGWIEVESQPGNGTVFFVYFPALEKSSRPPAVAGPASARKTVLVVEDDDSLRHLIRELLGAADYTIHDAACGDEALRLWNERKQEVDLVLTDMELPGGLTGVELASRFRMDKPDLTVILSTGRAVTPEGNGFLHLHKPYHPEDLLRAVRGALEPAGAGAARPAGD